MTPSSSGLTITLVRLLPAEAYGQFGFLTTLLGFFTLYSFREFLGHTLQVRDGEAVHYQDHFTAGAVMQVLFFALVNVVAIGFRFAAGLRADQPGPACDVGAVPPGPAVRVPRARCSSAIWTGGGCARCRPSDS